MGEHTTGDYVATLRAERDTYLSQRDGYSAMLDEVERALDAAGVTDVYDTRTMVQTGEDTYEEDGEYRQADPAERVGFLVAERDTLRADLAAARAEADALRAMLRGRVAPEVFARAVREAMAAGYTDGDNYTTHNRDACVAAAIDTLTAADLTDAEARAVVEGVGR